MRKLLFVAASSLALLAGCTQSDETSVDPAVYQQTAGIYEGTLPAADCPGIRTTLYLKADKTYNRTSDYLERGVVLDEAGEWTIDNKGVIHMKPLKEAPYKLEKMDGSVRFLTAEGKPVEGELAQFYVLKKN